MAVGLLASFIVRTDAVRNALTRATGVFTKPIVAQTARVEEQGEIFFLNRRDLVARVRDLESRVSDVALNAAQWGNAMVERDAALELLHYVQRSRMTVVAVRVLYNERVGSNRYVTIDRGANDGIRAYDPVVEGDGILLGVVEDVFANTARVALITNDTTRIGAMRVGASGTLGVIEGGVSPLVELRYVPQQESLHVNDLIVTSGIDPHIPEGLVIGLVNVQDASQEPSFATIQVEPLADLLHPTVLGVLATGIL